MYASVIIILLGNTFLVDVSIMFPYTANRSVPNQN